jgi:hypothetical protein
MNLTTALPPALAILLGLVVCFFGYRLLRFTLGLAGFGLGMFIGFAVVGLFHVTSPVFGWVIALACGILFALLATVAYKVGVFLLGAAAGVLLSSLLLAATGWPYPILVRLASGLVVGLLTLLLERTLVAVLAGFAGAWVAVAGVSALLNRYDLLSPGRSQNHAMMLGASILLGVLGAAVQLRAARRKSGVKR